MFDYLKQYDDMCVFSILLDEYTLDEAMENLHREMGFSLLEIKDRCKLYKNENDERSFMIVRKDNTPEPFFTVLVKSKISLRNPIFACINEQMQQVYEAWSCHPPEYYIAAEENLLAGKIDHGRYFVEFLTAYGFIDDIDDPA